MRAVPSWVAGQSRCNWDIRLAFFFRAILWPPLPNFVFAFAYRFEYLWADDVQKKPLKISAPEVFVVVLPGGGKECACVCVLIISLPTLSHHCPYFLIITSHPAFLPCYPLYTTFPLTRYLSLQHTLPHSFHTFSLTFLLCFGHSLSFFVTHSLAFLFVLCVVRFSSDDLGGEADQWRGALSSCAWWVKHFLSSY